MKSLQIRASSSNIAPKQPPQMPPKYSQKPPKISPRGAPEASWKCLWRQLCSLSAFLAPLGHSWDALGTLMVALGHSRPLLSALGILSGHSWLNLGTSKNQFWALQSYFTRFLSNPSGNHSKSRPRAVQERSEKIPKTKSSSAG